MNSGENNVAKKYVINLFFSSTNIKMKSNVHYLEVPKYMCKVFFSQKVLYYTPVFTISMYNLRFYSRH